MTGSARCPDSERLAAFIDGTLDEPDRREMEAHLASCQECCHVVSETMRFRTEMGTTVVPSPWRRRRVLYAAAGLAATVILAVLLWPPRPPGTTTRGSAGGHGVVSPLVSSVGESRAVEGRLSGGFSWAPLEPFSRGGTRTTPSWEVAAAAGTIRKAAESDPSSENLHALGLAHLVLGDLDDAVKVLRGVSERADAGARVWSDLGAALLERGERKGRAQDFAEGLAAIQRARAADPQLPEARFNEAVALEKLHLDDRAASAWEAFLSGPPEAGWTEEARRRLERLRSRSSTWEEDRGRIEEVLDRGDAEQAASIVAARTQETRDWVEDDLLGAWAEALESGRAADAKRALGRATALAGILDRETGDPMSREIVAFSAAAGSRGPSRLDPILLGRKALREGLADYAAYRFDAACPRLAEAYDRLAPLDDPAALPLAHKLAVCEYYRGAPDAARRRIDALYPVAERRGFKGLTARALWLRGLLEASRGRLGEALGSYQRALKSFRELHEEENVAFTSSLVAEALDLMGSASEAFRMSLEAVSGASRMRDPGRAAAILTEAGLVISRQGYAGVALEFQDAAVRRAAGTGDPVDAADSLMRRAPLASAVGRPEESRRNLDESRRYVGLVTDTELRDRLEAEVLFAEGKLARANRTPADAVRALTGAIEYFRGAGFEVRLPELYLERARALRDSGDAAAAERDVEHGLEIFERRRAEIASGMLRISYFDTARGLFETLVGLQLARGADETALTTLERAKTRDLLDRRPRRRLSARDLSAGIPGGVAVVVTAVLDDRLLLWAVSGGTIEFEERRIGAGDLAALVNRFRDGLPPDTGGRLRELLLDPVASRLPAADTVVFVPDDVLYALPFAALPDPASGRFLVEERAVVVAPSVSSFLEATAAARTVGPPASVLAVGDPAFDVIAFPYLPRLSVAADEARTIAAFYPRAEVLVGKRATQGSVLAGIERAAVAHLACHALRNDADPLRAQLLLAPDLEGAASGSLFAEDLYGRSFGPLQLVVLAACETGTGRISRGEGPLSLARPFLAAGVPAVVATLWEIQDAPSAELLERFHREVASGTSPETALREAKIACIRSTEPALRAPANWAAFELIGGVRARA